MPAVFPESNAKIKIGPPDRFARGSETHLGSLSLWVIRDSRGLYAISAICTHLGCVTKRDTDTGNFKCACHGSQFNPEGTVTAGPAPKGLNWLALSVAPDGQVVVDRRRTVKSGTRLVV